MTTLTSKLQEVSSRIQRLTVWKSNEFDPFLELDRWRRDAHSLIEEIFVKKRQQIELTIEKHEREFLRQIVRQKSLLENLRRKWLSLSENSSNSSKQSEISIRSELIQIEDDIQKRLGRAEILIKTEPIDFESSIKLELKKYLTNWSPIFGKENEENGNETTSADRSTRARTRRNDRLRKQLEEIQQSNKIVSLNESFQSNSQQRFSSASQTRKSTGKR